MFSGSLSAAGLADAQAAVNRGDFVGAVPIYETLVNAGNSVAMVDLARLIHNGRGTQRDLPRVIALYHQAAALGNADAQFSLGNMYLLGEGVPQDDDWAFTYYRQAALQGHVLAAKNVNEFYRAAGVTAPATPVVANVATTPAAGTAERGPMQDDEYQRIIPLEYSLDERNAIDLARNNGLMVEDQESPAISRGMSAKPDVRESSATPTLASTRQNLAIGAMDQA
ncbi:MAG: tetratricopeptide repeat protein, partial [Gammaproteobacteria bacterium]